MGGVVKRLVLDQLGFAPVFIALMLSILILAEGRADDVADNLNDNWANAVLQYVVFRAARGWEAFPKSAVPRGPPSPSRNRAFPPFLAAMKP
jgi:hypothetical protein